MLHHYTQNDINREPKLLKMWLINKVNETKKEKDRSKKDTKPNLEKDTKPNLEKSK